MQRLKHGDSINVDFYTEGINHQHQIAPLLLINFIENSFKHGDADSRPDAFINVGLTVEDGQLRFSVQNSFKEIEKLGIGKLGGEGFGLKNAQRLLDLAYPNRYELAQKAENGVYSVNLKLLIA